VAQVAGRTGRGPKGGRVVVQSFTPQHFSVRRAAAHDYLGFAREELSHRAELMYPPFGRVVRIVLDSRDDTVLRKLAAAIGDKLKLAAPGQASFVLGPVPCPISRIRGRFRWHILIKAPSHRALRSLLDAAEAELLGTSKVAVAVDVDALAML
jgi:primosomal protein N' (replication factor Y)